MALVPFRKVESPIYTAGFEPFDRLFDRMFGNALTNLADGSSSAGGLPLRLDVAETGTTYTIKTDLPGVEQKDVEVTIEDFRHPHHQRRENGWRKRKAKPSTARWSAVTAASAACSPCLQTPAKMASKPA